MTYAIGNSHARVHERNYEAQQQAADEQERYEAWIDDQADSVLRAPFVYMTIIEEAEACMVGSQYLDAMRLAFLSDAAGFAHIAQSYKAAALAPLEREIKDILRIKTPKSQWRKQQELCHEY